jgi:hypothetical protein
MTTLFRNLSIETFEFVWDEFIEIHDSILRTERKRKKVGSRIKYHPPFKETPQDRAFKIDTEYNMILKVLLLKPDINPIEIAAELNSKLQNIKQDYLVKKNQATL